jgi:ribose 5-phosphate isomerase A
MNLKRQAACEALNYVKNGMVVGLGTGSTTTYFIELLADRLKTGHLKKVCGVPTSEATGALARTLGIPLTSLAQHPQLDLAVDGADEVDPDLNLIKGLGHALLREKVVEIYAQHFLVIVDESKMVSRLGTLGPLPVEIVPFQAEAHVRWLGSLGCRAKLLLHNDGSPSVTDNGNYLAHCLFPDGIADLYGLARALADRPGIIEHGLFLGMAHEVIVAADTGIRVLKRH